MVTTHLIFLKDLFQLCLAPSQSIQTHVHLGLRGFFTDGCSSASRGFGTHICVKIQRYHLLQELVMFFTEMAEEYFLYVLRKYCLLIGQKSCSICPMECYDNSHTWEQVEAISRSLVYFMLQILSCSNEVHTTRQLQHSVK